MVTARTRSQACCSRTRWPTCSDSICRATSPRCSGRPRYFHRHKRAQLNPPDCVTNPSQLRSAGISIKIKPGTEWSGGAESNTRFIIRFIGANGHVLAEAGGRSPLYSFKGDEPYVRASILDSNDRRAWTQPVLRDGRMATGQ